MRWSEQPIEASDEVLIRLAKKSDAKLEVKLDVLAFGMDEEDARSHLERIKERQDEQFLMIEADNERSVRSASIGWMAKHGFTDSPFYLNTKGEGTAEKCFGIL